MNKELCDILSALGCGSITAASYIFMADGTKIAPIYTCQLNKEAQTMQLHAEQEGLFRDTIYLRYDNKAITARRVFQSRADSDIRVKELGFFLNGIDFGSDSSNDYYYHIELPRYHGNNTLPIGYNRMNPDDEANTAYDVVPGADCVDMTPFANTKSHPHQSRIGASLCLPFPAILLSNYQVKTGLVHGTLSQDVFYHNYEMSHDEKGVALQIYSSFKNIDALTMEPGRIIVDEWYLGRTEEADDLDRIFANYSDVLRAKLQTQCGKSNANRRYAIWGSWNDLVWRNISEDILVEEARFLQKNFPTVKWLQVDDGYSTIDVHGLGMAYDDDAELDKKKFPNGFRHYTDAVRLAGLRPAVWISLWCPEEAAVRREHPEWFLQYKRTYPTFMPFDVSRADVREFMEEAVHKFFKEYGFDAVKMDFWSHAFEDSTPVLTETRQSGYELRRWWLQTLRSALPTDGYLQTCCDVAMGNPFLGEFASNYRYGSDISGGDWEFVKATYHWGTHCFATHTGDLFVPNSDSIGLLPDLNEDEAMFVTNYCMITHSMVELAGRLSQSDNKQRIKILQKAFCNPNNGQDVYLAHYDYRTKTTRLADTMYCKTPHFSCEEGNPSMPLVTVAMFNVYETGKTMCVSAADLKLPEGHYTFTNVWTGEQFSHVSSVTVELAPHGSVLFAVSCEQGLQLYDANLRINKLQTERNVMTLETDYAKQEAELMLNAEPKAISLNGRALPFETTGKVTRFNTDSAGALTITFE